MTNGFYLVDEKHKTVKGDVVEIKDVLYFRQSKSGFDNKATKDHVKAYPGLFQELLNKHPKFVLPASFSDEEIGAASFKPVPEEAVVVAKETPKTHGKGKHE